MPYPPYVPYIRPHISPHLSPGLPSTWSSAISKHRERAARSLAGGAARPVAVVAVSDEEMDKELEGEGAEADGRGAEVQWVRRAAAEAGPDTCQAEAGPLCVRRGSMPEVLAFSSLFIRIYSSSIHACIRVSSYACLSLATSLVVLAFLRHQHFRHHISVGTFRRCSPSSVA